MELIEVNGTVEQKLFGIAKQKNIPLYGVFELTPLCNMNCDICYVKLNKNEMVNQGDQKDLSFWINLVNQVKEAGVLFILLTGGEPLLYPYFKELYLHLLKVGIIVTINTNGTLINEEWADFFEQHKPRRINITLYGSNEEEYRNLCHYEGYAKTLNAINLLKERNINVKLNGTISRGNKKSVYSLFKIANDFNLPILLDTYLIPSNDVKNSTAYRQNPKTAAEIRVEAYFYELGVENFIKYAKEMIDKSKETIKESYSIGLSCYAGSCSFAVNWQGNLYPCITMKNPSIKIDDSFMECWKKISDMSKSIRINKKCARCNLRHVCVTCAANAYLEGNDFECISSYLCEYAKYTIFYLQKKLNELENKV